MYICYVEAYKKGERVNNIEVEWWSASKLESKYSFKEVVFAGELDFHLTVSAGLLKEILDDNIHVYSYDKLTDGIRMLISKRASVTEKIEEIITNADEYDELKIVLFYWQSMDGAI